MDVDKIYLATLSYKNGVLEGISDEELKNKIYNFNHAMDIAEDRRIAEGEDTDDIWSDIIKLLEETRNITLESIKGAITNRLLLNYIDVISDSRNYAASRASIDSIVNELKGKLVNKYLNDKHDGYLTGMHQLTPSFQALRKMEFMTGKKGIGSFAWNITNLAQTQFTHLTIDFGSIGEEYGFGSLDQIYCTGRKDDLRPRQRISDWLSAMVSAHVDVEKDPYIFALNVNQATYNHTNLLLRVGKGLATFTFLAQPILKDYANTLNNAGGIYGEDINNINELQATESRKNKIYKAKVKHYCDMIENYLNDERYENSITNRDFANQAIEYYRYQIMSATNKKQKYKKDEKPSRVIERNKIFDEEQGISSIQKYRPANQVDSTNISDVIDSIIFQLACLETFKELEKYANALSTLVFMSQIDTKTFGNNLIDQLDWLNRFNTFVSGNMANVNMFYINDPKFFEKDLDSYIDKETLNECKDKSIKEKLSIITDKQKLSEAALYKYFTDLYLGKKLNLATYYTKRILSNQLFTATDQFQDIFKLIVGKITGTTQYKMVKSFLSQDSGMIYDPIYNQNSIKALSNGLDNIFRFYSFMNIGYDIYQKRSKRDDRMIDFTIGGNIEEVVNKFRSLVFGDNEQKSIFVRLANLISTIKKNPSKYYQLGLINDNGDITNELLNYLNPITPNSKYPIGRMLLNSSQTDNSNNEEKRLIASFAQLLDNEDEEVRRIAYDLVFYAYFSHYDQNVSGSIFHLVPYQYRKQYDLSLRTALNHLSSFNKDVRNKSLSVIFGGEDTDIKKLMEDSAQRVLDIVSRNYWYDDNIVPVYYTRRKQSKKKFQAYYSEKGKDSMEFLGDTIYDTESRNYFPSYISTTHQNKPYIKLRKGKTTVLYKNIGVVNRTYTDKKGNEHAGSPFYIYAAVQKAGLRLNRINQFELFASFGIPSIFKQNKLDRHYAIDKVKQEIEKEVEAEMSEKDVYYKLDLKWDNQSMTDSYIATNSNVYIQAPQIKRQKSIVGGDLICKNNSEFVGQSKADVVIDVSNLVTEDETIVGSNIIEKFKEKRIELALSDDISNVVEKVKELANGNSISIHFTSAMYDSKFTVTDEEFNDKLNSELDKYKSALADRRRNMSSEQIDALVAAKRTLLENDDRNTILTAVAQDKLDNIISEFVNLLAANGVNVVEMSSAITNKNKKVLARAIQLIKQTNPEITSENNSIYVNSSVVETARALNNMAANLSRTSDDSVDQQELEEDANVEVDKKMLIPDATEVEKVIEEQSDDKQESSEQAEEQPSEEPTAKIIEEVKEDEKDEAKNKECGNGGSKRSRFSSAESSDARL